MPANPGLVIREGVAEDELLQLADGRLDRPIRVNTVVDVGLQYVQDLRQAEVVAMLLHSLGDGVYQNRELLAAKLVDALENRGDPLRDGYGRVP